MKCRIIFLALLVALFSVIQSFNLQADTTIPNTVKVGILYGNTSINEFKLKSPTGIIVQNANGQNLLTDNISDGFIIKKDELSGPYHIQIGAIYNSIDEAKAVQNTLSPFLLNSFLVYEDGWRIWLECLPDENQSLIKLNKIKEIIKNYELSIIKPVRKRVQLNDYNTGVIRYIINTDSDIIINPIDQNTTKKYIDINDKKYRGTIRIKRLIESDITVINELNLEEYLYGVVPSESPSVWPIEALKAQAVAARNFSILNMNNHSKYGFDLCNTQHCQVYKGLSCEQVSTNNAVNQTKGILIYYDNKPINAFYHSSSGGHTESSENIFSSPLPYIVGVDDSYSLGSNNDNWIKSFDKEYIKEKLTNANIDIGDVIDIVPLEKSQFGRVLKVDVKGTTGNQILLKEKIRTILGSSELKSIWYELKTDADLYILNRLLGKSESKRMSGMSVVSANGITRLKDNEAITISNGYRKDIYNTTPSNYTFYGKGYGHGLGMSQYGAKGMAEAGYDYIQILEHYYQGTNVH